MTITAYKCSFELEVSVTFEEPIKAKAFFIDGDWKDYFFEADDLEELAEQVSTIFHSTEERFDPVLGLYRDIDGFGTFCLDETTKVWKNTTKYLSKGESLPCGRIFIEYMEPLTHVGTTELSKS